MAKIIWLTGHSKAGKSTIADALAEEIDCIVLHGDDMRDSISLGAGFSREARREHNLRVARLANILSSQKVVVVAVIAPMVDVRREIDEICKPRWIWVKRNVGQREGHFYEPSPEYPIIDTDLEEVPACVKRVRSITGLGPPHVPYSLLIGRYQPLHDGHKALIQKVIDEGRKPLIALRDTPYGQTDPFTVGQRRKMLQDHFGNQVKVIVIPDIEEVVYGRKVGWGIRQIDLPAEIQAISATAIRESMV